MKSTIKTQISLSLPLKLLVTMLTSANIGNTIPAITAQTTKNAPTNNILILNYKLSITLLNRSVISSIEPTPSTPKYLFCAE